MPVQSERFAWQTIERTAWFRFFQGLVQQATSEPSHGIV
jgi:hypothetical protein